MPTVSPAVESPGKLHLLVADEDAAVRAACCEIATELGFVAQQVSTHAAARALLLGHSIDVLLLDLKSPFGEELDLLDEVTTLDPELSVVVMTAYASVHSAVESMRIGAADYLTKPFTMDELAQVLERAGERRNLESASRKLREHLRSHQGLGDIIGRSPEMEKLYRILSKVAQSSHPAVIVGESGVGKELVARSIHDNGLHRARAFYPVDCASIVPELLQNELFGYAKGAFAGAARNKEGLLVSAEGGTLLLDEVGELSLDLQAKLFRALQEKEIRPPGSAQPVPMNVRILAATSQDLAELVEQGRFRKDLYYRLNVVTLRIPPLRERTQDIPLLAAHFLDRISRETGTAYTLGDATLRTLMEYAWPGNVRELENSLERACALSSGPIVHLADLPTQLQNFRLAIRHSNPPAPLSIAAHEDEKNPVVPLSEIEKQAILDTLRKLDGDKIQAAKLLGIGKTTLYRKLKEYGIGDPLNGEAPGDAEDSSDRQHSVSG